MAISFNKIPADIRVPLAYVEFDNSGAVKGTPVLRWRILAVGQKLKDAEGPVLAPTLISTADQAAALWGRGSMIASMFDMVKRANTFVETWGLAVDDADAGVAATGGISLSGQAQAGGTVNLYVGGRRIRCKAIGGESASAVLTRLGEAINAAECCVTAAPGTGADAGALSLACRWAGTTGNDIDLRVNYQPDERLPPGLSLTIAPMAGGTGNPDLAPVIAAFGDEWWKSLIMPYTDLSNRQLLEEWLETRFGPLKQRECQCWTAYRGTLAQTAAYGNGGNSQLISCMATGQSPTPPWEWAASYAAVATASLSIDPARPLQTLVLPGVLPPALPDRWTMEERNILLFDGMATHMVADDGKAAIEREITMHQNNVWGMPDLSYLDVQTPATLGYWRYAVRARIAQKFPRHKLADDGTRYGAGQAVATPRVIRGELLALHEELEEKGLLENFAAFKEALIVERNADDRNRLDVLATPDLVNQFRIFAMLTRFVL